MPGAAPEQLTFGEVRDSDPAPAPDGALYFIRKTRAGTALMRLAEGSLARVALDAAITDLRDLETGP